MIVLIIRSFSSSLSLSSYNEGRNSIRSAILVQLFIENSVGGLHCTDSMTVHVEVILRVDETYLLSFYIHIVKIITIIISM